MAKKNKCSLGELLERMPFDITVGLYENVYFALIHDDREDGRHQYVCEALSDKGPQHDTVFVEMPSVGDQPLYFMRDTPEEALEAMLEWLQQNGYVN